MHGRPRKPARAEDPAAADAKAAALRDLQSQLLHNHQNRIYTKEALSASSKLLEINPEVYTGWNYRKLALQHNLGANADPEVAKRLVDDELRVVEAALRQNPKSYGAWYHRKWLLKHGFSPVDFDREFKLIGQLLKLDRRNFHGWSYRRFMALLKNIPYEEELNFTMDKINENISNYSAWHYRSYLLSKLLRQRARGFSDKENVLTEEYNLVHEALFTDDQSGWFYHHWLLGQTSKPNEPFLASSWPVNESEWILSKHGETDRYQLRSTVSTDICYSLRTGRLPVILYFDQAVKGVNSLTVKVVSKVFEDEDVVWIPLSTMSSVESHCWVAYLKIRDMNLSNLETISVGIDIGQSYKIVSSNGSNYSYPLKLSFTFKLDVSSPDRKVGSDDKLFSWEDKGEVYTVEKIPDLIFNDRTKLASSQLAYDLRWNTQTLCSEINLFQELVEENGKFPILTLARLLVAYDALTTPDEIVHLLKELAQNGKFTELTGTSLTEAYDAIPSLQKSTNREDDFKLYNIFLKLILELYNYLIKLDPFHAKYYRDEQSLIRIIQATCSKESFLEHFRHKSINSINNHQHVALHLGNFSLTRLGYFERLIWVHILDLSHNELQSVEGLEALQLLRCLNLSNNHISSFTALVPIKLLASLRVLDISNNKIGNHRVNTRRYLCSSPLSHAEDIDIEELKDHIKSSHSWEAILIFKGLRLTQLSIEGNAVVDVNMRILVQKLLPLLIWLDGQPVK